MKRILLLAMVLLTLAGPVRGEDTPQYKSADESWAHLQELLHQAPPPDPSQFVANLEKLRGLMVEFENRYPNDPRRWEAKLMRVQVESMRAQVVNAQPDNEGLLKLTKEIGAAADASPAAKADARYLAARVHMAALESSGPTIDSAARKMVESDIAELRKDYPDDLRTAVAQLDLALFFKMRDADAAESILRELEGSKNLRVVAAAQQELDSMRALRKLAKDPIDLKFQAVDGAQIDLAKLRGKVVLVEFWATWCGPCRMEVPNVVATYNQLHKHGFEIVGVSLDQNKDQLVNFTKQVGMTWPQYFDGKGWGNEVSSRYGINSIPTSWLVDKKGRVRSTEARGPDLVQQVKLLLAE